MAELRPNLQVVIADLDGAVARVAARAVRQAGFLVGVAHDVEAARELLRSFKQPTVLVVDWNLCGAAEGALRLGQGRERPLHVIATMAGGRPADVAAAAARGADECINKPLSSGELVARIEWAAKMLAALPPLSSGVRDALLRASRGATGEVVVSRAETVARIWFVQGEVAWAAMSDRKVSLRSIFQGMAALDSEVVKDITREAKQTGKNVLEVLVDWGLATREEVRTGARKYLCEVVRAALLIADPDVVFAPGSQTTVWSGPRFPLVEIVPPETKTSFPRLRSLHVVRDDDVVGVCDFAPGCRACSDLGQRLAAEIDASSAEAIAIVHGPTAEIVARAGQPMDPDVIRAQVQLMTFLQQTERPHNIVITSATHYYVLAATACADAYVGARAARETQRLGALKFEVERVAASLYVEEGATSQRIIRSRKSMVPPPSEPSPSLATDKAPSR